MGHAWGAGHTWRPRERCYTLEEAPLPLAHNHRGRTSPPSCPHVTQAQRREVACRGHQARNSQVATGHPGPSACPTPQPHAWPAGDEAPSGGRRGSVRRPSLSPGWGRRAPGWTRAWGLPARGPHAILTAAKGRLLLRLLFMGEETETQRLNPPPRPHSPTHGTVGREPPARLPVPRPPCTGVGRTVQLAQRAEGERGDEAPQSRPLRPADLSLCLLFGQGRPMPSGGERPGLPTLSGLRRP